MATFGDAIVDGIRTAWCAYFRTVEGAEDWFARLSPLPAPDPFGDLSDSLYRWTCGTNEDPPQLPPPPFTGGQCPIVYAITITFDVILVEDGSVFIQGNTNTSESFNQFPLGPIAGVDEIPNGGENTVIVCNAANGQLRFGENNNPETFEFRNIRITRVEPLNPADEDLCGNPPPILPPVAPVTIDVDINDNDTIINAPVTIGPFFITAIGGIYAPVTIELPDVNLNGTLEITPEFTFFPDFDLNIGTPPSGPETEPPPDSPSGPGSEEPDPEPEPPSSDRRIIAVLVNGRIESDARPSGIFQEVGPNIYAPRLASVRFGTQIGSTIFWANDIPVKTLRGVIECPIPWGASHVVLNAEPGVAMSYSTVSSEPNEYPPFLELGPNELSDNR